MKRVIARAVLFVLAFTGICYAQDTLKYKLNEITVTAGRIPVSVSEASRTLTILSAEEISELSVNSIADLLQYVNGVDLKQRGTDGIQADISIRGGTFEQTLVMIDGVAVNDPQTGHHTLNLPISLNDIDRIEVLKGQGSKAFGPNAFSGAINIITKTLDKNRLNFSVSGGENGFYQSGISGNFSLSGIFNRITYQKTKSDGYIHNTNYEKHIFSYGTSVSYGKFVAKGLFGYNDKKFGANSFYTTRFPNQWEHTKTMFANGSFLFSFDKVAADLKLYYRRNDDEFLLDYENPGFYKNNHRTNIYGVKLQATYKSRFGTTAIGGEIIFDEITSNNLGDHKRTNQGFFVEHLFSPIGYLNISLGGFLYNYDRIGWKFWPGVDFNYLIDNNAKVFGSIGKAFRRPSYTELYYSDPVTSGNADLQSEETLNSEIGIAYNGKAVSVSLSLFNNNGKNIIDWVRKDENDGWYARNISSIVTNGAEVSFRIVPGKRLPFVERVDIQYTYLSSDKESDNLQSRYALEYLSSQAIVKLKHHSSYDVMFNWSFRYEERLNAENIFIADLKLNKKFDLFDFYISFSNLFNKHYSDFNGVQLPGRWLRSGFDLTLQ